MTFDRGRYLAAATRAGEKGDYSRACRLYEAICVNEPEDMQSRLQLGLLYRKSGNIADSLRMYYDVARHETEHGNTLKAASVYQSMLREDAGLHPVHLALARVYLQLGCVSDAISQYREAMRILDSRGQTVRRLHVAREMLAMDTENLQCRIRLAEDFAQEGQVSEAVEELRDIGQLLRREGRLDEYVEVAGRLVALQPNHVATCRRLAEIYLAREQPEFALYYLSKVMSLLASDVDVLELMARCFDLLGQTHKSVTVLREVAKLHDQHGLLEERDDVLARILALDPTDKRVRLQLGERSAVGGSRDMNIRELTLSRPEPSPALSPAPIPVNQITNVEEEDFYEAGFEDEPVHDIGGGSALAEDLPFDLNDSVVAEASESEALVHTEVVSLDVPAMSNPEFPFNANKALSSHSTGSDTPADKGFFAATTELGSAGEDVVGEVQLELEPEDVIEIDSGTLANLLAGEVPSHESESEISALIPSMLSQEQGSEETSANDDIFSQAVRNTQPAPPDTALDVHSADSLEAFSGFDEAHEAPVAAMSGDQNEIVSAGVESSDFSVEPGLAEGSRIEQLQNETNVEPSLFEPLENVLPESFALEEQLESDDESVLVGEVLVADEKIPDTGELLVGEVLEDDQYDDLVADEVLVGEVLDDFDDNLSSDDVLVGEVLGDDEDFSDDVLVGEVLGDDDEEDFSDDVLVGEVLGDDDLSAEMLLDDFEPTSTSDVLEAFDDANVDIPVSEVDGPQAPSDETALSVVELDLNVSDVDSAGSVDEPAAERAPFDQTSETVLSASEPIDHIPAVQDDSHVAGDESNISVAAAQVEATETVLDPPQELLGGAGDDEHNEIAGELKEFDFYVRHGLVDEARLVLDELPEQFKESPQVLERLSRLN